MYIEYDAQGYNDNSNNESSDWMEACINFLEDSINFFKMLALRAI